MAQDRTRCAGAHRGVQRVVEVVGEKEEKDEDLPLRRVENKNGRIRSIKGTS